MRDRSSNRKKKKKKKKHEEKCARMIKKKKGCIKRNMHNLRTECFILSITYVDTICSFTFQINVFHSKPFCHSFSPSSRPINLSNFYLSPYFHLFQKRTTINSFFFKNMITIRSELASKISARSGSMENGGGYPCACNVPVAGTRFHAKRRGKRGRTTLVRL